MRAGTGPGRNRGGASFSLCMLQRRSGLAGTRPRHSLEARVWHDEQLDKGPAGRVLGVAVGWRVAGAGSEGSPNSGGNPTAEPSPHGPTARRAAPAFAFACLLCTGCSRPGGAWRGRARQPRRARQRGRGEGLAPKWLLKTRDRAAYAAYPVEPSQTDLVRAARRAPRRSRGAG